MIELAQTHSCIPWIYWWSLAVIPPCLCNKTRASVHGLSDRYDQMYSNTVNVFVLVRVGQWSNMLKNKVQKLISKAGLARSPVGRQKNERFLGSEQHCKLICYNDFLYLQGTFLSWDGQPYDVLLKIYCRYLLANNSCWNQSVNVIEWPTFLNKKVTFRTIITPLAFHSTTHLFPQSPSALCPQKTAQC